MRDVDSFSYRFLALGGGDGGALGGTEVSVLLGLPSLPPSLVNVYSAY